MAGERRVFMRRVQEERVLAEALETDRDQRDASSRHEPSIFRDRESWRDQAVAILGGACP